MYIIDLKLKSAEEQKILHDKILDRVYDEGVSVQFISRVTGIGYQSLLNFSHGRSSLCALNTNRLRKYFSECGK